MTVPSASNAVEASQAVAPSSSKAYLSTKSQSAGRVSNVDIIDIRRNPVELDLKEEILSSLRPKSGPKKLPTLLLYDERGLQLFEEITFLEEYFLTNAEINVLECSADSIAKTIPSGAVVMELGSGNLRKVSILLQALNTAGKTIDYYALDLSLAELKRTLEQVPAFEHVKCHGLHGTYDDGLAWLKLPEMQSRHKCVMSLGSSIGNFHRHDAASFLRGFSDALKPSDTMLIGLDATNDPAKVFRAYNDQKGVTHRFILNGLLQANKILKEPVFNLDDWRVIGEYVYDAVGGRHQAFYSPIKDIRYQDIDFKAGERVQIEQSLKYSVGESRRLWADSGLSELGRWSTPSSTYNIHLLAKQDMAFDSDSLVYAAKTVPTLDDWQGLWAVWDTVTRHMIPDEELLEKPIKLRNACIFYIGHIPTFLDIQLSKVTALPPCEPSYYPAIFERGVDPDVDNPEKCHNHSEVPNEWPPVDEIIGYQGKVRAKVQKLCEMSSYSRDVGRALWIGFEHEIMHLETLLYMLLQSDKILPPKVIAPDFEEDAKLARAARVPNKWFEIPEQTISIGLDDPEDNSGPDHHFGWDNEKPPREAIVPAFKAQARPISNEEYARYLEQTHSSSIPASWTEKRATSNGLNNGHAKAHVNGQSNSSTMISMSYLEGKAVRTVYGPVPLEFALDWPVFASYDELAGCASWMGGRIPTFEEARSIYKYADSLKAMEAEKHLGKTVPAVNGHLINNGVQESPPSRDSQSSGGLQPLFTNLKGANVGFANWHPVAVTANGNTLSGQSGMGGLWEWTSSVLTEHEGFEPMALYPAYTADFFDGKHNIVLGGSWATHPRIAGRKTFINWYQHNYPYAWVGARLIRDL